MHFKITYPASRIPNNALIYRANEYSFAVIPWPSNFTSVLINDLNLELDQQGRVIFVWGLCPYTAWKQATLEPPHADFGDVYFVPDSPLEKAVSVRLKQPRWPIYVDNSSGWIHIDGGCPNRMNPVKVMAGVIIVINSKGDLCSIWLKPDQLPDLQ